jgi:PEP-CTERM motif
VEGQIMVRTCVVGFCVSLLALPAQAAVIFDNGDPAPFDAVEMTSFVESDDFSTMTRSRIDGAGIYVSTVSATKSPADWQTGLRYWIFGDAGDRPGAILTMGDVAVTIAPTNFPTFFSAENAYLFSFDFTTPFVAEAGVRYWLGIYAPPPVDYVFGDIGWVATQDNPSSDNHFSAGGTFDNWEPAPGYDLAFFLNGSAIGGVPEPATWAMMMLGFGAAGGMMRYRRRKTSVAYA